MALDIALPMPPSVNRIWRHAAGRARPYLDTRYATWKRAADNEYLAHKREWKPVAGNFKARIVLNDKRRRGDADNRIKALLDWLQRVELIENDKLCDSLSVRWGYAPMGVLITITPVQEAKQNRRAMA